MGLIRIIIVDGLRALFGTKSYEKDYLFSVEIYQPVVDRITSNIISSDIEEGGKFLGEIFEKDEKISIGVYTYIDAGPNVSNSRTHIIPDGDHQEYLFRVIENYDPDVEHIGSWHSHHSNGYQELSQGDIETYLHNVNNASYNLDWFFVMLITGLRDQTVEAKFYLFHRGDDNIYEIPHERIMITNKNFKYENILREAEQSTYFHRNQRRKIMPEPSNKKQRHGEESVMNRIRLEDKIWFGNTYPSARMYQNKKDNTIYWRWFVTTNKGDIEIKYIYPGDSSDASRDAILTINHGGSEFSRINIELNNTRLQKIYNETAKAVVSLS